MKEMTNEELNALLERHREQRAEVRARNKEFKTITMGKVFNGIVFVGLSLAMFYPW